MRTLFLSDLHLEDGAPERTAWLMAFLEGPARRSDAVYILGDLFEYWIGDDAPSATAKQVADATAELVSSGVPCRFIHGNRDFLIGADWASRAGIQLLPEAVVVDLYGTPTLLLHGDTLCTDDWKYQAFRRQARKPVWRSIALALPAAQRERLARKARSVSMAHTAAATEEIMDVNQQAVLEAFQEHDVRRMIHGHTHRPAHHRIEDGALSAERIVLADWYAHGSYLEVTPDSIESHAV